MKKIMLNEIPALVNSPLKEHIYFYIDTPELRDTFLQCLQDNTNIKWSAGQPPIRFTPIVDKPILLRISTNKKQLSFEKHIPKERKAISYQIILTKANWSL